MTGPNIRQVQAIAASLKVLHRILDPDRVEGWTVDGTYATAGLSATVKELREYRDAIVGFMPLGTSYVLLERDGVVVLRFSRR